MCVVYTKRVYIHKHNQFNSCREKLTAAFPPQKSHKIREKGKKRKKKKSRKEFLLSKIELVYFLQMQQTKASQGK